MNIELGETMDHSPRNASRSRCPPENQGSSGLDRGTGLPGFFYNTSFGFWWGCWLGWLVGWLVGGNSHIFGIFTPKLTWGRCCFHFDEHIVQMGWFNHHQLGFVWSWVVWRLVGLDGLRFTNEASCMKRKKWLLVEHLFKSSQLKWGSIWGKQHLFFLLFFCLFLFKGRGWEGVWSFHDWIPGGKWYNFGGRISGSLRDIVKIKIQLPFSHGEIPCLKLTVRTSKLMGLEDDSFLLGSLFSGATVDGRNPAPPGMYKTL